MGKLLLEELLRQGVEVDLYLPLVGADRPAIAASAPLRVIEWQTGWRWGRWYSRTKPSALFTSLVARSLASLRLSRRLLIEHRHRPYDFVYQLSQTELFLLGRARRRAPRIVVHPCTHAAGELRWHRAEQSYALQSEKRSVHMLMRGLLTLRSYFQPSELARAHLVLGLSQRFNDYLRKDYGVPADKLRVVRTPVDLDRFTPPALGARDQPRTLLFVSRISTRKGVEELIELSYRLRDLAGSVRLLVVGGPTQWSDYTAHLERLNPMVAEYVGGVPNEALPTLLRSATMLIVPSRYEPGSIATAEALACGLSVVLSDEVGAGEVVDGPHVRFHRAGDVDGLEGAVRSLLDAIERDEWGLLVAARTNAEEQFSAKVVTTQLLDAICSQGGRSEDPLNRTKKRRPSVTICIPTRGRPDELAAALASITETTYPVSQVIVSDDLHDPATERVCLEATIDVHYLLGPRRGLGANRNWAIRDSTGDLVLFIDDDCVLHRDFLATAIARQQAAEVRYGASRVIVSGRVLQEGRLIAPGDQTFLGFQSKAYTRDEGLRSIVMAATIFPARVFSDVRFDSRLVYGYEEVDLAIRAVAKGYTIVDCPQAIVEHRTSDVGRKRNLSYSEASRLHVTLRRYVVTERTPIRALAFVLAAPVHHVVANVKRNGLHGLGTAARTLGLAAAMFWRSR